MTMPDNAVSKCTLTGCILVYMVLLPYLEWNASHVFNLAWPAHARFHEVWQLCTNALLGGLALWFVWRRSDLFTAAMISSCIMGGILLADSLSDNLELSVQSVNALAPLLGMDLAVLIALIVVTSFSSAFLASQPKPV